MSELTHSMKRISAQILIAGGLCAGYGCGGSSNGNTGTGTNAEVTVTITANQAAVSLGQTIRLTWSSVNASSCLATSAPPESDWTALVGTSGSTLVTPQVFGGETYSLTCSGGSGAGATASTSITVNSAASGLVNGPLNSTSPATFWVEIGNSCVLNGQPINGITVLGESGQNLGQFYEKDILQGGLVNGAGGRPATWNATADGTGMLMNYSTAQCSRSPVVPVPVSLLNISGSASSGKFSAQLVDQTGIVASCSFALVPAQGFFTVCF